MSLAPSHRRFIWLAYWGALFVATHLPKEAASRLTFQLADWLLHGLSYGLLAALTFWARGLCSVNARSVARGPGDRLAAWVAVLGAYGVLDEVTQPIVGRSAQLTDWLADLSGVAAAAWMCAGWRRRNPGS